MNAVRVACLGCNRVFSPRSLSHHLRGRQHDRCRIVHEGSHILSTFQPVHHDSLQPSAPIPTLQDPREGNPGDEAIFDYNEGTVLFDDMYVGTH